MSLGKCVIDGQPASVVYPLLAGSPAFCNKHHNSHDAGPFGADFSGPDDFDIPDDFDMVFRPPYNEKTGEWTDQTGKTKKLSALEDSHLWNIRGWIIRISEQPRWDAVNIEDAMLAVDREITTRQQTGYLTS